MPLCGINESVRHPCPSVTSHNPARCSHELSGKLVAIAKETELFPGAEGTMAQALSLVVILLLSCVATAEAQVWSDPVTAKGGPQWRSSLDSNRSSGGVDPHLEKETTRGRHPYLESLRNQNNFSSGRSTGHVQNPYQFNPYQIRW